MQLVVFARRADVLVDHATREEPESVSLPVRVGGSWLVEYVLAKVRRGFPVHSRTVDLGRRAREIIDFRNIGIACAGGGWWVSKWYR